VGDDCAASNPVEITAGSATTVIVTCEIP
jgi:hypothetical protein